jgi:hypothetical protein
MIDHPENPRNREIHASAALSFTITPVDAVIFSDRKKEYHYSYNLPILTPPNITNDHDPHTKALAQDKASINPSPREAEQDRSFLLPSRPKYRYWSRTRVAARHWAT